MGIYEIGSLFGQLLRYTSFKVALAVVLLIVSVVLAFKLGNGMIEVARGFLASFERKEQALVSEIALTRNQCAQERVGHQAEISARDVILRGLADSVHRIQETEREILDIVKKHRDDDQRRAEG